MPKGKQQKTKNEQTKKSQNNKASRNKSSLLVFVFLTNSFFIVFLKQKLFLQR